MLAVKMAVSTRGLKTDCGRRRDLAIMPRMNNNQTKIIELLRDVHLIAFKETERLNLRIAELQSLDRAPIEKPIAKPQAVERLADNPPVAKQPATKIMNEKQLCAREASAVYGGFVHCPFASSSGLPIQTGVIRARGAWRTWPGRGVLSSSARPVRSGALAPGEARASCRREPRATGSP